ncbi:uncharacterized protein LOC103169466 [Ornithorhynchus anatinus]|uniref:uncharacterized protein LOC103169466 n=1 Tax=Ornithorhynchus anatinus TaxID=9258 RepID=UPI0004542614|nr:uncharacterized protein LOC103169466 [Ornithorhynchus anatinus]
MWEVLETLLFPIIAILWAFQWPLPDEGFALLFLILLLWQVQRGHVEMWKKEDQVYNLGDRSPVQSPANHPAFILHQHRLKYWLQDTSDEVWRLGQEHTKDPEANLILLKRFGLDTFSGKDSCIICQYLRNEVQRLPTPPEGWEKLPRPRMSFCQVSQPEDSKLAQCTCSAGTLPPRRVERPQILQVEENRQQHCKPQTFPCSGRRQSESPKEKDYKDLRQTSLKLQALPEALSVGMKAFSQPSLLSPKTRSLLEQHLKSMLHFQQLGLPRWILEAQSLLAPQVGDQDIPSSFPWRKGAVMPKDSIRMKMLNSKKEEYVEEHVVQKSHQKIPSVVPSGQGDTSCSPPQAPLSSQGPPALSGPRGPAPTMATSLSPDPVETKLRTPDQRAASFLKLSSNLKVREDQRLLVKPTVLPEASIKSLDSVLQQKYMDFLSGFSLMYNRAISSAVSRAGLARISLSTEGKPAPIEDRLECNVADESNREKSKEPKLSPTADCKGSSLGSRQRHHTKEAQDHNQPLTQMARAPQQKSQGPHHLGSCPSKMSLCPPGAARGLEAPTGVQGRKKNVGESHSRGPLSALAARSMAYTQSSGPQVSTSGPARHSRGCQTMTRAMIFEKLKLWFSSIDRGQQVGIGARAQLTAASGELKKSSASSGNSKPLFPQGPSTLQPGFSALLVRGPCPTHPQTSSSGCLPGARVK